MSGLEQRALQYDSGCGVRMVSLGWRLLKPSNHQRPALSPLKLCSLCNFQQEYKPGVSCATDAPAHLAATPQLYQASPRTAPIFVAWAQFNL